MITKRFSPIIYFILLFSLPFCLSATEKIEKQKVSEVEEKQRKDNSISLKSKKKQRINPEKQLFREITNSNNTVQKGLDLKGSKKLQERKTEKLLIEETTFKKGLDQKKTASNDQIEGEIITPSGSRWITFKEKSDITNLDVIEVDGILGLEENNKLVMYRESSDRYGMKHYRYHQYYKGILVDGADFITHEKDGKIIRSNGVVVKEIECEITPSISKEFAIQTALKHIGADKYYWEDENSEKGFKLMLENPDTTSYPQPKLILHRNSLFAEFSGKNFVLAYKMDVWAKNDNFSKTIIVNALNGEIIGEYPLVLQCTGTFMTTEAISQPGGLIANFCGTEVTSTEYNLRDEDKNITIDSSLQIITDDNTTWTSGDGDSQLQVAGANALWISSKVQEYFTTSYSVFSLVSIGNSTLQARCSIIDDPNEHQLASFAAPNRVKIGLGDGNVGLNTEYFIDLDVIGHEWGHSLVKLWANLTYVGETASINESYADIFGRLSEGFINSNPNWKMGENLSIGNLNGFRNMQDPNALYHPDTYYGNYWQSYITGSEPKHANAGVLNYCYYLLVNGGTTTNDNNVTVTVNPIGETKAEALVVQNLEHYLTSNSNFFDARLGSMYSAFDVSNITYSEVFDVLDAWDAVGVVLSYVKLPGSNLANASSKEVDFIWPTIYATSQIEIAGNSKTFTIKNNGELSLFSGNNSTIGGWITIKDGFHAENGSKFLAHTTTTITGPSTNQQFGPSLSPITSIAKIAEDTVSSNSSIQMFPKEFGLSHNYPNPFNPKTKIEYALPKDVNVILKIYNILGQEVISLVDNFQSAGYKSVIWEGKNSSGQLVSSGTYFYRLKAGDFVDTKKMLFLK